MPSYSGLLRLRGVPLWPRTASTCALARGTARRHCPPARPAGTRYCPAWHAALPARNSGSPGEGLACRPRYPVPVMTGRKSFGSDNHAGAHPEVLGAIAAPNGGDAGPYGADYWTSRAANDLCAVFVAAGTYLVFNSTAPHVLVLRLLVH